MSRVEKAHAQQPNGRRSSLEAMKYIDRLEDLLVESNQRNMAEQAIFQAEIGSCEPFYPNGLSKDSFFAWTIFCNESSKPMVLIAVKNDDRTEELAVFLEENEIEEIICIRAPKDDKTVLKASMSIQEQLGTRGTN